MFFRYRREVKSCGWTSSYAEYTKELWEETTKGSPMGVGKRLVDSCVETYKGSLENYELYALANGWEPPMSFVYIDNLPEGCVLVKNPIRVQITPSHPVPIEDIPVRPHPVPIVDIPAPPHWPSSRMMYEGSDEYIREE